MRKSDIDCNEKVVVTGIGLVTPLGIGREPTWSNLIAGRSGIDWIDGLPIPAAGRVKKCLSGPRTAAFAEMAAGEAIADAGLEQDTSLGLRCGCTVSAGKADIGSYPGMIDPDTGCFSQESANCRIRKRWHLAGPGGNYSAACATGIVSINAGMMYLKTHAADACLVGSSESSLSDFYLNGFKKMGVYAPVHEHPDRAIKPFDRDRSGFLPGEGAGVMMLEKATAARKRGVHIYASVESCVIGSDGYHQIIFNANGKNIARVINEAIARAGWKKGEIDYINAHGTGTRLNDRLESMAFKHVFGDHAYRLSISSTKAGTGHLLGAGGSVEAAFCLLAMRDHTVPPTLNLLHEDPVCDLDYTPLYAREKTITRALSLSYGFGGHIGAVAFEAWQD